ncbi:MAG TPA: PQQ-binding-like beta-propeller repeat protein, partial [Lacipirellulaceae bacterium]|nr:PQQ-binding-like beta-propeller repeat protein [Lacipirellulaceae bacterium]
MKLPHAMGFIAITIATSTFAAEPLAWPQFRGPNGTGIAEDQKPPTELGPEKNVKWKVAVPSGMSSPIIVGDKVVLTSFNDNKLYTLAFNRADGSEAWDVNAPAEKIESFNKAYGSPAASTCATDGKHIVSYFGSCGLFCYDTNGDELWRHEMPPAET